MTSSVDNAEVLYDAFKETYNQAKTIYRVNILLSLFTLLIIILVMRDVIIIDTAEPKMATYEQEIAEIDEQLKNLQAEDFVSSKEYFATRNSYNSAKSNLEKWHKDLPARKAMKTKYEKLLTEYSNSHDKVMERLRIDGEPGLKLFSSLKDTIIALEDAEQQFEKEKQKRLHQKRNHKRDLKAQQVELVTQKEELENRMKFLKEDIARIQYDETRLPWLGLRINPKDLLPLMPIVLLIFFHILFYKFEELLTLLSSPEIENIRKDLIKYPLPIFLGRKNFYAVAAIILMFGLVPVSQGVAALFTYLHQISFFNMSGNIWQLMVALDCIALLATVSYPIYLYRKFGKHILSE